MKYYITIEDEDEDIFEFETIELAWKWAKKYPDRVYGVLDFKSVKRNYDPRDLTPIFWEKLRRLKKNKH